MSTSKKISIDTTLPSADLVTGTFPSYDATELCFQNWKPKKNSNSSSLVAVLVHGMGDHSGHMMTVVEKLIEIELTVYAYDQRGHGKSPGKRGHISSWKIFREDLQSFCNFVCTRENKAKLLLFGNSMGGALVLDHLVHQNTERIKGAIVNAPALVMHDLKGSTGFFVGVLSGILPSVTPSVALDSSKLTRDEQKQQENSNDELVHTQASFKLLAELRSAGSYIFSHPELVKNPLLLLQGDSDPIVCAKSNKEWIEKVKKTNEKAQIILIEGGMHETFNDTERDPKVLKPCADFIQALKNEM